MALDKYIVKKYKNITTSTIEITEDKLELILRKDVEKIRKTSDRMGSIGIFVSLLIAVLTTNNYRKFLGIGGESWQIIFRVALFISLLYMLYCIVSKCKHRIEVDDIISHIKDN